MRNDTELLKKMDRLLLALIDHTNRHEDCCLKKIVGLALTSPSHEQPSTDNNRPSFTRVDYI